MFGFARLIALALGTLVPFQVVDGGIPASLTGSPGNAKAGIAVIVNRKLGNCLSCHKIPVDQPDQGNVGPDLAGIGARMTPAQLRLQIVNPKVLDPATIMPAYYRVDGLRDVAPAFAGKPILTAQQVEDVVAYLSTVK